MGERTSDEFPRIARAELGIDAVELVSPLLRGARREQTAELARRANGEGVRMLLIMVDDEGDLSHPDRRARSKAVARHRAWLEAAARLGAHGLRVNTGGERRLPRNAQHLPPGSPELRSAVARCAESIAALADEARPAGVSVLLENHGGISANPAAIVEIVCAARRDNVGTLPDFGNFLEGVDRYEAVRTLLPHARALSAKSWDFLEDGRESTIDFARMIGLAREAGYEGYVGIEYEGARLPEMEGIRRTKALLERCFATAAAG